MTPSEFEIARLQDQITALQQENERLNRLKVHCPDCGGDYAATGLEVGCPCKLRTLLRELAEAVKRFVGPPQTPEPNCSCRWCQARAALARAEEVLK